MPQTGMLDLEKDPTYTTEINDGDVHMQVIMSRENGVAEVALEINGTLLSHEDLCRLMKDLLMGFYLTTEFKAEYIPEAIRGNIRQAVRWVQQQGAMVLPMLMSNFLDVEVINGKPFAIELGYAPNIETSGMMDSLGRKVQSWDGSFRPVIHLTEVINPVEYTGEQLEPVT